MKFFPTLSFGRQGKDTNRRLRNRSSRRRALLETLEDRRLLAAYVVTTVDDIVAVDGHVSLREAILSANSNTVINADIAVAGSTDGDTIEFDAALSGATITLDPVLGQLLISDDVTIDGSAGVGGSRITIDAMDNSRVLLVDTSTGLGATRDVSLSNFVLTNGNAGITANSFGGGISSVSSTLSLNNVDITSSDAFDGGGLSIEGGSVSILGGRIGDNEADQFGGGISGIFGATITIDGGTSIDNNIAGKSGGGLFFRQSDVTIDDAIVDMNDANGALVGDGGGGIANDFGSELRIAATTAVTISNNTAVGTLGSGGGILNSGSALLIVGNGTQITGNRAERAGGGIEGIGGSSITLTGVSITGNTAQGTAVSAPGNGGGLHVTGGGNTSITGGSVSDNVAAEEGGGLWNGTGVMTISGATINGNHADAGNNTGNDQGGGGVFNNGGTLSITGTNITNNEALLNLGNGGGVMSVGGTVSITSSAISGNKAARAGGGIEENAGTVNLTDVAISANTATVNGGGLHTSGPGMVTISGGTVSDNVAGQEGGGLWNSSTGTMTIRPSMVSGTRIQLNDANGDGTEQGGGGLFNDGGIVDVTGATFFQNVATAAAVGNGGGGIFNDGQLTLTDTDILENDAVTGLGNGGGILNSDGGVLVMSGGLVAGNSAARAGGGIENNAGSVALTDVTLGGPLASDANTAGVNGGGLHTSGLGTVTMTGGSVSSNTATNEGGGLWNSATGTLDLTDTNIQFNVAVRGGGVFLQPGAGTFSLSGGVVSENVATGNASTDGGGGIYNDGATTVTLDNVTIEYNAATGTAGSGGGIFTKAGTLTIDVGTIQFNSANRAGGGIEVVAGTVELVDTNLISNDVNGLGAATSPMPGNGGGLHVSGAAMVSLTGGSVFNNEAASEGGGLWNSATGTMTVDGTIISANLASGDTSIQGGGGIFNSSGVLMLKNATVEGNIADGLSGSGGGVMSVGGTVDILGGDITGNSANRAGGGIEMTGGTATIAHVQLVDNEATGLLNGPGNGGGLHITGNANVSFVGGSATGNKAAAEGGAFWNSATGTLTISGAEALSGSIAMPSSIVEATGADTASIQASVDNFRNSLGSLNANSPGSLFSGRREINWDAAPDSVSAPNVFPSDFFNAPVFPRARGVEFSTPGTGFELSATTASGVAPLFGNQNANYATSFATFSAERLFAPLGSNVTVVKFFVPGTSLPAAVAGFGAVFTDVDTAATTMEFFDQEGNVLATRNALATTGDASLSFLGFKFDSAVIAEVRITAGNSPLGPDDDNGASDVVVIDDLIFSEPVLISPTIISGNTADGDDPDQGGGGVFNDGGTVLIDNATIELNESGGQFGSGGGILSVAGDVMITTTDILGNSANRAGGGIEVIAGSISMSDSRLNDNDVNGLGVFATTPSPGEGGGLHVSGTADVTIVDSIVSNNEARGAGGGLWNNSGTMIVRGTTIENNVSEVSGDFNGGGGIYNRSGDLQISSSNIIGNSAAGSGGGVFNFSGTVSLASSTIANNSADASGGGLFQRTAPAINVGSVITNSTISGNTAGGVGGGIHNNDSTVTIFNSTVVLNRSDSDGSNDVGGGIWTLSGNRSFTSLFNSIVAGNVNGTDGADAPSDIAQQALETNSASNLIGDPATAGGLAEGALGNLVGDGSAALLPLTQILNPVLVDDSGVLVHELVFRSRALDAGDGSLRPVDVADVDGDMNVAELLPLDQRGSARIFDIPNVDNPISAMDIGAYELFDDSPATVTAPADVTIEGDTDGGALKASLAVFLNGASAIDVNPVLVITNDAPDIFLLGDTVVTFSVDDGSGNIGTATAIVTVIDTTAPSLTVDADLTIEGDQTGGASNANLQIADLIASAVSTDIVDSMVNIVHDAPQLFPVGPTMVTFTATDDSNNSTQTIVTVTVTDTTAPVISGLTDITVEADVADGATNSTAEIVALLNSTAIVTDIVDDMVTLTHNAPANFPIGNTFVTFTAKDDLNNMSMVTVRVTVQDTIAPTISAPADLVLEGNTTVGVSNMDARIIALLGGATAIDVADASVTITHDAPNVFPVGMTVVTFTATDDSNNSSTATATVTVTDTTSPTITAPMNISVEGDVTGGSSNTNAIIAMFLAGATRGDIVDPAVVVMTDAPPVFPLGVTTVTFTATDASNNSATAIATVTVVDTTDPILTVPANITIEADAIGGTPNTNAQIITLLSAAAATDIVDGLVTITHSAPPFFNLGTTVVTFTATDDANNSTTAQVNVTVEDTTAPTLNTPGSITVEADATGGSTPGNLEIAALFAAVSAMDIVDNTVQITNDALSNFPLGDNVVTFTAIDDSGNTSTSTATITVVDTTPPVLTPPIGITIEGNSIGGVLRSDASIVSLLASVTVSDIVGGTITVTNDAPILFPVGVITVTFTATDSSNNTTTATTTVTVTDQTIPVITLPANITLEGDAIGGASSANATIVAFIGAATASDIVDDAVLLENNALALYPVGVTIVSFTATDDQGNMTTAVATVTVTDTTAPTLVAPAAISVEADAPGGTAKTNAQITTLLGQGMASDIVDNAVTIDNNASDFFPLGVTTVTFTAIDASNNSTAATVDVTVVDTTAPAIVPPLALSIEGDTAGGVARNNASIVAFLNTASATDIADPTVTLSHDAPQLFPVGVTAVTFTASDDAGNVSTTSVNVTVTDTTAPVFAAPAGITVEADSIGGAAVTNTQIVNLLASANGTDIVDATVTVTNDASTLLALGPNVIRFTATDDSNNSRSATTTITVVDTTGPAITVPANVTLEGTTLGGVADTDPNIVAFLAAATANDIVDSTVAVTSNAPALFPVGATVVTFTAIDLTGNVNNATATVIVRDTTAPALIAPADLTVEGDVTDGATSATTAIAQLLFSATSSDIVDANVTVTNNAPATFGLGQTTVTFTARDDAGNTATATTRITVVDTVAPTLTPAASISVEADVRGGAAVTNSVIAAFLSGATVSDIVDSSITFSHDAPSLFLVGTTIVTFTATDNEGNTATATSDVTVTDTTKPTLVPPSSIIIEGNTAGGIAGTEPAILALLAGAIANDIVDASVTITNNAPSTFAVGVNVVMFTARDGAGNTSVATTNVTVTDTTLPILTAPADIVVEGNAIGGASRSQTQIAAMLAAATATDIVDTAVAITNNAPTLFPLGTTVVTFTAVDDAGNTSTDTATVTVIDTTAPTITAPTSITLEATTTGGAAPTQTAIATLLGGAIATDDVDASVTVTNNAPMLFPLGTTVVTFTATDDEGNVSTATSNVTITDTTAPVITAPADLTIEADAIGGSTSSSPMIAALLAGATATDIADGVVVISHNGPASFAIGTTTIVFTATDDSGNSSSASATVTVTDSTAPTISAPVAASIEATSASGILSTNASVSNLLDSATATDIVDGAVSVTNDAGTLLPLGQTLVTFTAIDAEGNLTTATTTFTIVDTTAPTIVAPADATVAATGPLGIASNTSAIISLLIGATASDAVDTSVTITSNVPPQLPLGATVVTFTATDDSGNSATATVTITVVDSSAPTVTAPSNATFEATSTAGVNASDPQIVALLALAVATDLIDTSVTLTNDAPTVFPIGSTVVTFTGTDNAGNIGTATTTVTIADTTVPTVTAPAAVTLEGDAIGGATSANSTIAALLAGATGSDLVDSTVTITNDAPAVFPLGTTTVTFTGTDDAGNIGTATSTVNVTDTTAPTLTPPAGITVNANVAGGAEVTLAAIAAFLSSATAVDLVDGSPTITNDAPTLLPIGTTTVLFTARDDSGNSSIRSSTITVNPVATAPVVVVSPSGPNGTPDPDDLPSGPQPTSWAQQRTSLREVTITLAVPAVNPTAAGIVLTNLGMDADNDPDVVIPLRNDQLTLSSDGRQLRITFDANQLSDGIYKLDLLPSITGGETFSMTGDSTNKLFVLYGDWNGSSSVTAADFATFAYWFGQAAPPAPEYLDGNNSGSITAADFARFAANFGRGITFPNAAAQQTSGGEGEAAELLTSLVNPPDVNGDGLVTASDALEVLHEVSLGRTAVEGWSQHDVNRDGAITAGDALQVINGLFLNELGSSMNDSNFSILGQESEPATVSTDILDATLSSIDSVASTKLLDAAHALTGESGSPDAIDAIEVVLDDSDTTTLDNVIELLASTR